MIRQARSDDNPALMVDDDAPPHTRAIQAVYVDPDRQGAGHGRALVEAALAELVRAREDGRIVRYATGL